MSTNKVPRRFKLLLSSNPGLLLFHLLHHPRLLLLLFDPLIIASFGLSACILHLRLLFLLLLLFHRLHLDHGLVRLFQRRPLTRFRTASRAIFSFSSIHPLLLKLFLLGCFFLQKFRELHLLFLVNNWDESRRLSDRQVVLRGLTL